MIPLPKLFCTLCGRQIVETSSGLYCINLDCKTEDKKPVKLIFQDEKKPTEE